MVTSRGHDVQVVGCPRTSIAAWRCSFSNSTYFSSTIRLLLFRSFSLCFSFAFHNNNSTDNEFLNSSAFRGCGVHCRYLRLVVVFDPDNCSWRIAGLRGTRQPQRLTRYGLGWGHRHIYSFRGNYKGKESIHYAQTKVFRCTKKSNCLYFVYLQYTVSLTRAVSGELVAEFEASHL